MHRFLSLHTKKWSIANETTKATQNTINAEHTITPACGKEDAKNTKVSGKQLKREAMPDRKQDCGGVYISRMHADSISSQEAFTLCRWEWAVKYEDTRSSTSPVTFRTTPLKISNANQIQRVCRGSPFYIRYDIYYWFCSAFNIIYFSIVYLYNT